MGDGGIGDGGMGEGWEGGRELKIGTISSFLKVLQNGSNTRRNNFQACPPGIEEVEFST